MAEWLKQISGKQTHSNPVSINKADGSPCENEDEVLLRWREHFEQALYHSPGTSSASLDTESASATAELMPQPQPTSRVATRSY